ncbi:hypothetical protein [Halomonas sp. BL6]|uniref:hypothetical protein n=1 Tax=Halomonas sp. BL6 TaxID=2585770 RepID=UPI002100619D|nr:hypothetical protein [Halomonas sp. BL6]
MAWVVEARGATQYGVQQQFGMGFGYAHPETGLWLKQEFMTMAKPLAISHWEAIRASMEYEVHSLAEVQDPQVVRNQDDPPWEGVHTLRNAHVAISISAEPTGRSVGCTGAFGTPSTSSSSGTCRVT